jgi:aldose 1-epimerase
MNISIKEFGKMPDGRIISSYQLNNEKGMEVRVINYGGIITHLFAPDKNGKIGDLVLGFDDLKDYLAPHPYFGAIIGRYANRIGNASFILDGKTFGLAKNDGNNHLHGGSNGFDKKVWFAAKNVTTEFVGVKLAYESPDGEESYPGTLMVEVEYILNNQNELVINYSAKTDKRTHVNLTNHSYFNLNSCKGNILSHSLQIEADLFTEVGEGLIPTGKILPVENTALDFRSPKSIGKDIELISPGYDNNFVINGYDGHLKKCAMVVDPESGRTLEVFTTVPGVQLYTSNYITEIAGKGGNAYRKHAGFCLETQHFPDTPNKMNFPSTILDPDKKYEETTIYRFGTI